MGQDVRIAVRLLIKDRWFTLAAVSALALCIGAGTTAFALVNALTRGLPVAAPDRVVRLESKDAAGRPLRVSAREVDAWRAAATLSGIAAFRGAAMAIGDQGRAPGAYSGAYVSAGAFGLLGEAPVIGRDFSPEDDTPGAASVVLLGSRVWRERYAADPLIIGRTVLINDRTATVVGVMPDGFRFPMVADVWQPLASLPGFERRGGARTLDAFGRLASSATIAQAQSELQAVTARLAREYPDGDASLGVAVAPFVDSGRAYGFFAGVLGAVALVLLIGCANVANLLLARVAQRTNDNAIRLALGATRWRLLRQLFAESALLGGVAGALGLGFAMLALRLIANDLAGINFPYWQRWTMDGRVVSFSVVVSIASAFVFGLAPALQVWKARAGGLNESRRTSGAAATRRWTSVLLAAELTISLILLAGAGLMIRSFAALYRADQVLDASSVVTVHLRLPSERYAQPAQRRAFREQLEARLAADGGIVGVSTGSSIPFIGAPRMDLTIGGGDESVSNGRPAVTYVEAGPDYFETLGLSLIRGRGFSERDGRAHRETAIVNDRFAAMHFPGQDPIGKRIRLTPMNESAVTPPSWLMIVGVSQSVRYQQTFNLHELDPVVYVPRTPDSQSMWLVVRGVSDVAGAAIRDAIFSIDPDLALGTVVPVHQLRTQSRWPNRVFAGIFAMFAWISVVLAAIGLYAVTAYAITQRTREIGVRVALGARPFEVMWLFVRRAIVPLAFGLGAGLAGAFAIGRLVSGFLVQTAPADPATLIAVASLLVAVTITACVIPARRAARLDPLTALRHG